MSLTFAVFANSCSEQHTYSVEIPVKLQSSQSKVSHVVFGGRISTLIVDKLLVLNQRIFGNRAR